jgi:hypothetical protein
MFVGSVRLWFHDLSICRGRSISHEISGLFFEATPPNSVRASLNLALQLPFLQVSESMGNHDSKIVDAGGVD